MYPALQSVEKEIRSAYLFCLVPPCIFITACVCVLVKIKKMGIGVTRKGSIFFKWFAGQRFYLLVCFSFSHARDKES